MVDTAVTRSCGALLFALVCTWGAGPAATAQGDAQETPRSPKVSLAVRASPMISFTPAKIRFVADIKGGPNDNEELYCLAVEWDWNDDTTSESSVDCEPYQPGKSQITRRFAIEHEYRMAGIYRVQIRLKKKSRVILSGVVQVQVNPSLPESAPPPTTSF